jgi:hypothetical protein
MPRFEHLGEHSAMADQAAACVTAAVEEKPNFRSGPNVPASINTPADNKPAGFPDLLDGVPVVPRVPPVRIPSQNYCCHCFSQAAGLDGFLGQCLGFGGCFTPKTLIKRHP